MYSAVKRAQRRLVSLFGAKGFHPLHQLTAHSKAVLDINFDRLNDANHAWRPKPYTTLLSYAPSMKGNRGVWYHASLQFEHEEEKLYAVFYASAADGLMSSSAVGLVIGLDKSLASACAAMDELVHEHMTYFLAQPEMRKARYAAPPAAAWHLSEEQLKGYERAPFTTFQERARVRLGRALREVETENHAKAKRAKEKQNLTELVSLKGFS